jgi:tetratricopeptide (TPR) repeat protein
MSRSAEAATLAQKAVDFLQDEPLDEETLLLRGLSYALLAQATWFRDANEGADAARPAVQWLERVITQHGDSDSVAAVAYAELAWVHSALGHQDEAVNVCRAHLDRCRDPRRRLPTLMVLAEALRLIGQLREAERAAREALEHSAHDPLTRPRLYLTLGLIQRESDHYAEAEVSLVAAVEALREDPWLTADRETLRAIYGNLAEIQYEGGNLRQGAATLNNLLAQYPEDGPERNRILIRLGDCYIAMGRTTEARPYYEEVMRSPAATDQERQHAGDCLTHHFSS